MTEKQVKLSTKTYMPDPIFCKDAFVKDADHVYQGYLTDPDGFWARISNELEWFQPFDTVKDWQHPFARWFVNGKTNISFNCLDRHIGSHRRNKVALFWQGDDGTTKSYTYWQLLREVERFANGLKSLGVAKGDTVCIYMPNVPEQVIAMLACARIGAVHSVVFAGFGSDALHARITGAGAKVVITADASIRRGKTIPLKPILEEALINATTVDHVVVYRSQSPKINLIPDFEWDFYELMERSVKTCAPESMDAEDPLFILYTSGTTGQPKGIVHTTGGYMVGTYYTSKYVLDIRDSDVFWCTADPGWITGHSYIVYGPLLMGATIFITEGTPDYPDPGIWWKYIEKFGVSILYTAPTAIRMFMRFGEEYPNQYDLSTLRLLGSVGEPLNPEAFEWYYHTIGKGRLPIIDTWWQTETGMHMITTMIGEPMKPGFAGKPIPGVLVDIVDKEGNPVPPGVSGQLIIKEPWPSMARMVHQNEERYRQYWSGPGNSFQASDLAVRDDEGYIMILGRSDDLIIVSGHNIGTAEVESALVAHKAVAEAAVVGIPDEMKGNRILAFVLLREGIVETPKLKQDLAYHVRITLGPIAVPSEIRVADSLPKTRSGKIMRRVLRAQELGEDPGDLSTIEE
ncbi:MAG: acetate--CoA ligase [Methanocalculus sp. MSAO_Arc1]|uniref:acetate--CoA ligase n=1 Tax=Methanocalculus TaxID=71151 RepID=UPI000FF4A598|nr:MULTISPECIES: acetate--CoA ligase [unclassified Methanocalculus]MCP1662532.1 acetyl-CoA synthetase [Methanocalculus sp. AMF5]RQD80097.1 MAG: acetate--CoA ligase [Methanocalculus sp. MSAO_Arc1]